MRSGVSLFAAAFVLMLSSLGAWQQPPAAGQNGPGGRGGNQQPVRDRGQVTAGTGAIAGRVLTADTGRPVKRARIVVSGAGRGGRSTTTDDQGRYQITDLVAGSYTVAASKSGFVDAVYGQRRPLQPGTPVTLADAQSASNIDLHLIRGGVVTGRIGDEDGEALPRAIVTVQRYQYVRGERQLTPAGGDQTDDRGQYRIFGLPPGDYYVSVSTAGLAEMLGRGLQQLAAGLGAGGGRGGRGAPLGAFAAPDPQETTGYAPTYYPGVVNSAEAGKVTVGPGQEATGIDFQIQLVPLATISGVVAGADVATVMLVPQDSGGGLGRGQSYTGRAGSDGAFTIPSVPPGRYTAIARSGGRSGDLRTAMQPVVVQGQNIDGLALVLQPGVTVSGNIVVESSGTPAPADYSIFRVDLPDVDPLPGGGGPGGRGGPFGGGDNRVEKNGAFSVGNIQPGRHTIRVTGGGALNGGQWTLKSASIGATDVADLPIDLKPGQNLDNVTIVLTDRSTELSGTVHDARNTGVAGITVIAFSTDAQYWRAQSRRISTSRSGDAGAYRLRGLPAGDYYVLATDDVEQGEWFDPAYLNSVKDSATHVTLSDGDKKTLDLRGPS